MLYKLIIFTFLVTVLPQAAMAQRTLMFDDVQSFINPKGELVRYKQCYVILPSEHDQAKGTVLQLSWTFSGNRATAIDVARARYTVLGNQTTFQWSSPIQTSTEVARFNLRDLNKRKYTYRIESHDDKSQVGDVHNLTMITWNQLPMAVRNVAYENSIPYLPAYIRDPIIIHRGKVLQKLGRLLNQ